MKDYITLVAKAIEYQKTLSPEQERLAEEIEAHLMKKTTQRSPEFRGTCNN